jgi:hypothetical protein
LLALVNNGFLREEMDMWRCRGRPVPDGEEPRRDPNVRPVRGAG